jgi:hypothetical protein
VKRIAPVILITLFSLIVPQQSVAASKITPGSTCKKVNQQAIYKNKIYTCIKLGTKLYWDNGAAYKIERPTPMASQSAKPIASPTPSASATACKTSLPTPIITVSPRSLGYLVTFEKPLSPNFDFIEIADFVSESQTPPLLPGKVRGWQQAGLGERSPHEITKGDALQRWVVARFLDANCGVTDWSNVIKVTSIDPVAASIDNTPPAPIQSAG